MSSRWRWFNSLTFRLSGTLVAALIALFSVTSLVQIKLQGDYAHQYAKLSGLALTDSVYGALHGSMLANDRSGLQQTVEAIASNADNIRVRILNKEGKVVFSSHKPEIGQVLDLNSEACFKCHAANQPIVRLPAGERARTLRVNGHQALGVIRPIYNEPSCSQARCHAHAKHLNVLGVLDATLILAPAERVRRQTTLLMLIASATSLATIVFVVLIVVRRAVHRPISRLSKTLHAISDGDYTARAEPQRITEFSRFSHALNHAAQELERANAELIEWTRSLEHRVAEKTAEVEQAQERVRRSERMAALGRLAAIVAHEINNPLASVLTYAKLLKRRVAADSPPTGLSSQDTLEVLDAIAAESKRCGEIVSNLLSFARGSGATREPTDVAQVISKVLFLLKSKITLASVKLTTDIATELPLALCSANQLQQALLALCVNAIEAMPDGGDLRIGARSDAAQVIIEVSDSGHGISLDDQRHIFEPFFTTKDDADTTRGLGLGLTVVESIAHENNASLQLHSKVGQGTTFVLILPRAHQEPC